MTRNEASQKWCPMARAPVSYTTTEYLAGPSSVMVNKQHVVSGNRQGNYPDSNCACIHEKCMMWRTPLNDPDQGHCGLASYG